jgi:hypothetical protein
MFLLFELRLSPRQKLLYRHTLKQAWDSVIFPGIPAAPFPPKTTGFKKKHWTNSNHWLLLLSTMRHTTMLVCTLARGPDFACSLP